LNTDPSLQQVGAAAGATAVAAAAVACWEIPGIIAQSARRIFGEGC